MYLLLLWIGKLVQRVSRLFHNSGAALPGLIVERLMPNFIDKALAKLPDGVVVISGTNGKTTTTKLVSEVLGGLDERVLTNRSGSNMTRGLISTVISESRIFGGLPFGVAVLEVDEAYAAVLAKKVPIRAALVLNVMRDQLDRFGEIDTTAKYLGELTERASELVVLNINDQRVGKLPTNKHVKRITFGASNTLLPLLKSDDDWHGGESKAVNSDYVLEKSDGFELKINEHPVQKTMLEGVHNHLNFVAAFGLIRNLKPEVGSDKILDLLTKVKPAFGRGERVQIGDVTIDILLVKNPSSFVQTVRSAKLSGYSSVSIVINDAIADGHDVSWLWDIDVDEFRRASKLITCGTRRYDMANRLKYSEIKTDQVIEDEQSLIRQLSRDKGANAIFCTYTAMMTIRKLLVRSGRAGVIK